MTINLTEILSLLAKAQSLGIQYAVHEVGLDEYEIDLTLEDISYAHLRIEESQMGKRSGKRSDFDTMKQAMNYLDVMHQEKVKNNKRKAALDKLTDEEKELLGLK